MNRNSYIAIVTVALALFSASVVAQKVSYTLSQEDDQFLDRLERASILFFWEQADPESGQVRDRAVSNGQNEARPQSSTASTGFGLTALCIAHSRNYMDKTQIETRVIKTLNFTLNKLAGNQGFYYHFVHMQTGERYWDSELSSIDTALLLNGVIFAGEYFKDNSAIRQLTTAIYDKVNYRWMFNDTTGVISMGWFPDKGFLQGDATWNRYCELMMLVLQAIGAKGSNAVPAQKAWTSFKRQVFTYKGMSYISTNAPIFIHQFSHAWFDFRGRRDNYTNYFENSINATRVHKQWSLDYLGPKFPGSYTDSLWGLTASDSEKGYVAWGGPSADGLPLDNTIDGSIVPCAAAGSLVFMPAETLAVLKYINATYPKAWDRYGFKDAFNPLDGWYNPDVIGIDVGITVLMAENLRTGFVWKYFMQNEQMQRAMSLAGFISSSSPSALVSSPSNQLYAVLPLLIASFIFNLICC